MLTKEVVKYLQDRNLQETPMTAPCPPPYCEGAKLQTFFEKWFMWGSRMGLGSFETKLMIAYREASELNRVPLNFAFPAYFTEKKYWNSAEYYIPLSDTPTDSFLVCPYLVWLAMSEEESAECVRLNPVLEVFSLYRKSENEIFKKRLVAAFPHLFKSNIHVAAALAHLGEKYKANDD